MKPRTRESELVVDQSGSERIAASIPRGCLIPLAWGIVVAFTLGVVFRNTFDVFSGYLGNRQK